MLWIIGYIGIAILFMIVVINFDNKEHTREAFATFIVGILWPIALTIYLVSLARFFFHR